MEYLHKYHTTSDAPVHFYLVTVDKEPDRLYFTYQDLIRNINPEIHPVVHCFDGRGKKMADFYVFRGLNNEVVIANDAANQTLTENNNGLHTQ